MGFRVWIRGLWVMFRLEWFKGLGFGLRVYGLGLEFRGLRV